MANNISDAEKMAREELFPELVNGWNWPGQWDNEGLHQQLLRLAEERIAESKKKTGDPDKPVREAKKTATRGSASNASAQGPDTSDDKNSDVE